MLSTTSIPVFPRMPLPAAAIAAYTAVMNALPAAAPVIAAGAVSLGLVISHKPDQQDIVKLASEPEAAAECMQRNVAALNTRLVALVQPLQGTETMGVIVKRGIVGDPVLTVVIQQAVSGSTAEMRPLMPADQHPDVIAKLIAGC
jgi:hypothetical protein